MLGILLVLGALLCLSGLLAWQLAQLVGWITWPLLWYLVHVIAICAALPGAYLMVMNLNPLCSWFWYALVACLATCLFLRWPVFLSTTQVLSHISHQASTIRRIGYGGLTLCTILATLVFMQTSRADGRFHLTLLTSASPSQGQALLLRAPDGQIALIDVGADSPTLTEALDSTLSYWQRSLALFIMPDTSANNLAAAQDVVTRYHVGQVVDAGMLHPGLAYARWRSTLAQRGIHNTIVRFGTTIAFGSQVSLQVFWPDAQLHKSSSETDDNALVFYLLAPGLRFLLMNTSALSSYVLRALLNNVSFTSLQVDVVQINQSTTKSYPAELSILLHLLHPSLLLVNTTPGKSIKNRNSGNPTITAIPTGSWQILPAGGISGLEVSSDRYGWKMYDE